MSVLPSGHEGPVASQPIFQVPIARRGEGGADRRPPDALLSASSPHSSKVVRAKHRRRNKTLGADERSVEGFATQ
jgi:hypothetical protein